MVKTYKNGNKNYLHVNGIATSKLLISYLTLQMNVIN